MIMKKIIFTLIAIALISMKINAQTIGIAVVQDVPLCSGSEETGGDASSPVGETVTYKIVDIDGKIYAKTITSVATMSEVYAGQIRELKEDGSRTDCYLNGFDSYVTTRWTNDGFLYDSQDTDGTLSLFLMYVLPDWAAFYFSAPFDYTIGQVVKEDEADVTAPTLYEVYVDGSDLVFDCDDSNCFFYFIDNTGEISVSFENRYALSSLAGVTSLTAYAVDFSGNKSAEATYSFGTTVGSMKIDNAQVYYTDGEFANTSSPLTDYTLTTRIVDVNGIFYVKTVANSGAFQSYEYACQLRNNIGDGNVEQFWLANGNDDQTIRYNGSADNHSIGTYMYPDENTTEFYSLCLLEGFEGTFATQTGEYTVGIANSADVSDITAPVITDVSHTMLDDKTIVTVTATDEDDMFYLIESEEGMIVSLFPEFEVSSTVPSIDITAYDYSGNVSSIETYDFTNYISTGIKSAKSKLPLNVYATEGGIRITSDIDCDIEVYSITGALVYKAPISMGETFISLNKGFYIVNSTKVVVK